jgi:flagellar motor switch protein FliG
VALAGALAGKGAGAETAEFLLSNLSTRMADTLREETAERSVPTQTETEAAMSAVIATIRDLERAGTIKLKPPKSPAG